MNAADDRAAIANLLAIYCHRCDDANFEELLDCFTDDATFVFEQWELIGRERLRRWFERNQSPGKHVTTNSVIELDGDRARAVSDYVFLAVIDGRLTATLAGRYDDELQRIDGRWRLHRRIVAPMQLGHGPS